MKEKNICSNCIDKTGGCCTNVNLIIHKSEIKPFLVAKTNNFFPVNHSLEILNEEKNLYYYETNGSRCYFLSKENSCSIYDKRPTVCKMYPIVWKKSSIDPSNVFIDMLCPLTHAVPIREIYKQSKSILNDKMMKNIGPLVFNEHNNGYLNLTDQKSSSEGLAGLYGE